MKNASLIKCLSILAVPKPGGEKELPGLKGDRDSQPGPEAVRVRRQVLLTLIHTLPGAAYGLIEPFLCE